MKNYFKHDEWLIIEEGFNPSYNRVSESVFSIGNGKIGQRANFEEQYSGDSLQGSYVAGVYYPDKTRVGWWKNGYPEYFAKVPNATNWIGLNININGIPLNLATCKLNSFRRVLNMKEGLLMREFEAILENGDIIKVTSTRFCHLHKSSIGAIEYNITPLSSSSKIEIESYLDGDIENEDSNYDHKFWEEVSQTVELNRSCLAVKTLKTNFIVATASETFLSLNGKEVKSNFSQNTKSKYVSVTTNCQLAQGETLSINKYTATISSLDYQAEKISETAALLCKEASSTGFATLKKEQAAAWLTHWNESDIIIVGDLSLIHI